MADILGPVQTLLFEHMVDPDHLFTIE